MSVLPDYEIEKLVMGGGWHDLLPLISPYRDEQLSPSSYDVRLAAEIKIPTYSGQPVDLRKAIHQVVEPLDLTDTDGFMLKPGGFVLGSTVEWVNIPDDLVCRIEGKSSLARVGLQIHSAGYIDPGYHGDITLEITNFGPDLIHLWPDVLIGQLSFEFLSSPCRKPYAGRYQDSRGAVASRYNQLPA